MIVPWHGRATPLCALGLEKESEMKTQRAFCLGELVGLVPHEEELGKDGQVVVNSLCVHLLVNPCGDGGLSYAASCGHTPFAA